MADILSQSEIDELLQALASGQDKPADEPELEVAGDQVKAYDFRAANKFSKEQIRMLQFIHDNFASRLSTFLSGAMRALCEVMVVSVEEVLFGEFSNSLPSPAFLAVYNMPPLAGSSMLEISAAISYEIISRLFGGKGQMDSESTKPFTEIETAILHRMVQQILSVMDESWERISPVHTTLDRIETSSQFAQIVAANEPIVIITINVKIGEVSDIINLCIPHLAIQPITNQLATTTWYDDRRLPSKTATQEVSHINPQIGNTMVTLHAMFNTTMATIQDILCLQVGDVIRVDHPLDHDVTIMVEHIPKFKGRIGRKSQYLALKITDIIKEESEDG